MTLFENELLTNVKSMTGTSIFPTWIHFSAYYGLKMFTWALLEAPGGRCALSIPNCDGDTPSLLAFKNGYLTLAQGLETEMVSELFM